VLAPVPVRLVGGELNNCVARPGRQATMKELVVKKTSKLIVVLTAAVVLTFAACEGPVGPPGELGETRPAIPAQVINVSLERTEITLRYGVPEILTAAVYPAHAIVQTIHWELYDDVSGEVVSLRRPGLESGSSSLTGDSVEIFARSGGKANIRVIALGGDGTETRSTVAVTVESVVNRIDELFGMGQLPGEPFEIPTVVGVDLVRPQMLCFGLDDGDEVRIVLRGTAGHALYLHSSGAMFTVGRGVTLVLENVALNGMAGPNNSALVVVNSGGTLEMDAGSRILNNNNTASGVNSGGGVRVAAGGTLYMRGGEISGNNAAVQGGGVFNQGGVFTMRGGTIARNTANSWGGGLSNSINSVFVMYAGTIYDNTAVSQGGGVRNSARFEMRGGEIHGNTTTSPSAIDGGGGVHNAAGSVFEVFDGEIFGNTAHQGGGVNVAGGRFYMRGGEIFGNTANADGGGVRVAGVGRFEMRGGGIFENTARANGGGVRNLGIFRMYDGTISGNYASWATVPVLVDGYRGGGVFNAGTSTLPAFFDMHGGAVSGNVANWDGGGVTNFINGVFRMHDGEISGNVAGDSGFGFGGGVFNQGAGIFSMHGGVISGNNAHSNGGGVKNYFGGIFRIGGGDIYGNDAELSLRNIGLPGAALYTDTLRAQSWVVELNEDGTVATPPGTLLRDSVFNSTIRVENGSFVN